MKQILISVLIFCSSYLCGQGAYELKEVASENIYVASTGAAYNPFASNKRDRIVREVQLPQGTIAYTFRVSVAERSGSPNTSLVSSISKLGMASFPTASAIVNLASFSDGNFADVYIFDNMNDATKFANKVEGWWGCQALKQTTSTSRSSSDCLNMVAFGFRNDNALTGLNIFFELVAVIDVSKKFYSQSIRDDLYNHCIENDKIGKLPQEQLLSFCSCLSDKLANNPRFTTNDDITVKENLAKATTATCLEDLNIASKSDIGSAAFYDKVNTIETTEGKSGVIKYCEEKIAAGTNDDFVFNCVGWNCLLTKQFTKAAYYLKMGQDKYPLNFYIKENYAHSLLLTGKFSEAMEIYKAYINENIDENKSWKDVVIQDINEFKSLGISNEHFDEILTLMAK